MIMSYRGEASYQQRGPPARDNYYYNGNKSIGGPPQQDQYKRIDDNGSRESYDRPGQQFGQNRGQQQHNSREVGSFNDQRDTRPPAHRYPETFQGNAQAPVTGDSSWEARNHSNPAQNWGNEPQHDGRPYVSEPYQNQTKHNYQDRGRTQSPVAQDKHGQNYTNQGQYRASEQTEPYYQQDGGAVRNRDNEYQLQNKGPYSTPDDRLSPPSWSDQDRGRSYTKQQDGKLLEPPILEPASGYHQSDPRRDRNSSYSGLPPTSSNDFKKPYTQQGDGLSAYDQTGPPPQRQYRHNEYRDTNYRQELQSAPRPPPEPPQVIAKTSGTTSVFGIIAKVDTSPTRRNVPVTSPSRTNAPLLPSPTRDYTPSYDQYRDREPPRELPPPQISQQQHQYHHALTPISEKPSPPSSMSSRGHPPESNWSIKGPDQYRHHGDSGQSWHDAQSDRGYRGQNQGQQSRTKNNDLENQRQDQQPPSRASRPGYRDSEYTESSGYGSESAHNNEQQGFYDKGQYGSRFPVTQQQGRDDWPKSPTGSFCHSPPSRAETAGFREQYRGDDFRSPQVSQQYDQRYNNREHTQSKPPDSYGPPVSGQIQRRYGAQEYDRGPPLRNEMRPNSPSDYTGGHPSARHVNTESGVEESHVKSVRAAKNMFEKQSDPRRPPPAPKPILAPKPNFGSNVNTRPIPPRPRNLSDDGWHQQSYSNQYKPRSPQGPKSPTSPQYAPRPQQYQQRGQPSHSQSMDNLDDRSRYQSQPTNMIPTQPGPPVHAQSMQNLHDRSRPPPDQIHHQGRPRQSTEPNEGYRRSYSGPGIPEERPMVLAVKYNPDTGPSVFTRQDQQIPDGSWERPQREVEPPRQQNDYRPQPQLSPTRPYNDGRSWSVEAQRSTHQQSHAENSRNAAPNPPQGRSSLSENANYVPDVVARSYELANQSQQPALGQQAGVSRTTYDSNPQHHERDSDYRRQPRQSYQGTPENRNSKDRWPTPPPPVSQTQPPTTQPRQANPSYTDDWRRLGPPPQQHTEPLSQRVRDNAPPQGRQPDYPSRQQPQEYRSNDTASLQIPPPPHQPYPYDSDSSEVDVDAPTPPPSAGKALRPPFITSDLRSESPYEKNKPVPVTTSNPPDSRRRLAHQPENGREQGQLHQEPTYSKKQPQSYQSKIPQKLKKTSETKSPPPQKPQRNSTSLSPQATGAGEQNGFDFDMGITHQLQYPSSRERQRLGKSGALANRKPPSRNNSSSNLLQIENDDPYQIEVTDSDISARATMEVHREESMRILRATKKEKGSSSDSQSTVLERPLEQKTPKRAVARAPSSDQESELTASKPAASSKKGDSKFVFKKPSADAVKTIPLPQVTEPAAQATRRPPTYLGFGYTPEKPKTDLLTQFKTARNSAIRTAGEKQDRALKSVSAMVKFSHGKKEPKSPPKPKLTPAERNAKLLDKMHVEVKAPPPEKENRSRHPYHHKHHDERGHAVRSSIRSSSTVKPEKYDGDDDSTNGSRHERDPRGRGKERYRDDGRAKSRGRSTSRGRNLSPEDRSRPTRNRSKSRERSLSPPDRRRGRSTSRGRNLSPEDRSRPSRNRSKSRERSLSPPDRRRPQRDLIDRRYDERRRHDDDSSYHRRPPAPDRPRYREDDRYNPRPPQHRPFPQPYDRHRPTMEPDWVGQYRQGREPASHPARRAWVNDPRRVDFTADGRRRELDMDAFEREVKTATSYNSDFEQPEPRRHQMIPTKLSAKNTAKQKKQPPGDWMNALKERNRNAATARNRVDDPMLYRRRRPPGELQYYYKHRK